MMTFNIDFDPELYNDVLAIRQEIEDIKTRVKDTENTFKECKSKLFKYGRTITAFEHVLSLDKYKEMNEDIEKDEKFEEMNGE